MRRAALLVARSRASRRAGRGRGRSHDRLHDHVGHVGDNGWYRSAVERADHRHRCDQSHELPGRLSRLSTKSSDVFNCTAQAGDVDGQSSSPVQHRHRRPKRHRRDAEPGRPTRTAGSIKPVSISFSGSDATSGIASCTTASYGGPDSSSASVSGTCRDQAGNVSGASSYAAQIRRNSAVGHRDPPLVRRDAVVGTQARSQSRSLEPMRRRASPRAQARRRTRGLTRPAPRLPARASTTRVTARPDRSRSSTTRPCHACRTSRSPRSVTTSH